jgi:hypothetical protein
MSDITTVEEVQAGAYTVRVAQTDDGTAWEAVVLSEDDADVSPGPHMGMLFAPGVGPRSNSTESDSQPIGPPVTAPHRWVAIGFAIEAMQWQNVGSETVEVSEGYESVEVEGLNLDNLDHLDGRLNNDIAELLNEGEQ